MTTSLAHGEQDASSIPVIFVTWNGDDDDDDDDDDDADDDDERSRTLLLKSIARFGATLLAGFGNNTCVVRRFLKSLQ